MAQTSSPKLSAASVFAAAMARATATASVSAEQSYKRAQDYFVGAQALQVAKDKKLEAEALRREGTKSLNKLVEAFDNISSNVNKLYDKYNEKAVKKDVKPPKQAVKEENEFGLTEGEKLTRAAFAKAFTEKQKKLKEYLEARGAAQKALPKANDIQKLYTPEEKRSVEAIKRKVIPVFPFKSFDTRKLYE